MDSVTAHAGFHEEEPGEESSYAQHGKEDGISEQQSHSIADSKGKNDDQTLSKLKAEQTPRPRMRPAFRQGQMVRVEGLIYDTRFNGMPGVIFQLNPGKATCVVLLSSGTKLLCRKSNLTPMLKSEYDVSPRPHLGSEVELASSISNEVDGTNTPGCSMPPKRQPPLLMKLLQRLVPDSYQSASLQLYAITKNLYTLGLPPELSNKGNNASPNAVPSKQVGDWLRKTCGEGRFMIWNLCKTSYDAKELDHKVVHLASPCFPSLPAHRMLGLCKSVHSWKGIDSSHVAVLQCRTGRGRSSAAAACYLHYSQPNVYKNVEAALRYVASVRDLPLRKLVHPTQARFCRYFEEHVIRTRQAIAFPPPPPPPPKKPATSLPPLPSSSSSSSSSSPPLSSKSAADRNSSIVACNNEQMDGSKIAKITNGDGKEAVNSCSRGRGEAKKGLSKRKKETNKMSNKHAIGLHELHLERVMINNAPSVIGGGVRPFVQLLGEEGLIFDGRKPLPSSSSSSSSSPSSSRASVFDPPFIAAGSVGKVDVGAKVAGPFLMRLCCFIGETGRRRRKKTEEEKEGGGEQSRGGVMGHHHPNSSINTSSSVSNSNGMSATSDSLLVDVAKDRCDEKQQREIDHQQVEEEAYKDDAGSASHNNERNREEGDELVPVGDDKGDDYEDYLCLFRVGLDTRYEDAEGGVLRMHVGDLDVAFAGLRRLSSKFFIDIMLSDRNAQNNRPKRGKSHLSSASQSSSMRGKTFHQASRNASMLPPPLFKSTVNGKRMEEGDPLMNEDENDGKLLDDVEEDLVNIGRPAESMVSELLRQIDDALGEDDDDAAEHGGNNISRNGKHVAQMRSNTESPIANRPFGKEDEALLSELLAAQHPDAL
eukprot:jgi/Bigna1/85288/estExt_fgenesh1_pg.C_30152